MCLIQTRSIQHEICEVIVVDLENDSLFKQVDAIICMFYPSQCQNYLAFNKTTIFIPAHRFTINRCSKHDIHSLYKWMFEKPKAPVIVMAAEDMMLSISITTLESVFLISLHQVFLHMNLQQSINQNTIIISLLLSRTSREDLNIDPKWLKPVKNKDSIVRLFEFKISFIDLMNWMISINSKRLSYFLMLCYPITLLILLQQPFLSLFLLLQ